MKNKFLVLAFVLCILSIVLFASSCGSSGTEGLEYVEINDDEYGVKCGEAINASEIIIPSKYDGKKVTAILSSGFSKCENLVSITIPKTIATIEKGAFYNCKKLENVYFEGKLANWCNIDFVHSTSTPMSEAEHLFINDKEITDLQLEDVSEIKKYAFFGCENIVSFSSDNNLKVIGENAFAGCENLETVNLPSSLEKLEKLCFSTCISLHNVIIPKSVYQINLLAFYEARLHNVTFEDTEKWFFTDKETSTRGDKVDVTNPSTNASYLRKQNTGYWKRVLPTT